MSRECTEELFLKDVARHEMTVLHDDGVYRHIRFSRPGSGCMHFDLVTYPGHLVYSGDMGHYVFSRLDDMFEFFRTDRDSPYLKANGLTLGINLGYWAEKLQAVDSHCSKPGATEFSPERFKQVINEIRVGWMRERDLDKEQRRELWEAVDDEVLDHLSDGEEVLFVKASEFSWPPSYARDDAGHVYRFDDLWDHRFTAYTFRFIWCCYAIAWGIQLYDQASSTDRVDIAGAAKALVKQAERQRRVLTIEQRPRRPLAMGNHDTVVSVRAADYRNQPGEAS